MSLLTKPEDLKGNPTFIGMVYGQPGIGKSTLAASCPAPVFIDADNGMYRVEPHLRVPSLQVSSYDEVLEFINSDEINEFQTIVVDTAGKLVENFMEEWVARNNPKVAKATGGLTLQGYGVRKSTYNQFTKAIRQKRKNILYVCHEMEDGEGENKVIRPKITKSALADMLQDLDFMGYMEAQGSKRTISFAPNSRYYAKNSLGLDDVIIVPDTSSGNTFISEKIVKMNANRLEEQARLRTVYNEVIKNAQSIIINNPDLNNAVEALKTLETIWDSKYQIRGFLLNYANENGYIFNKETRLYEKADNVSDSSASDETFDKMKSEAEEEQKAVKTAKAQK